MLNSIELSGDLLPLHPAQENIYFEQVLSPNNPMYNIGTYMEINKNIDLCLLQKTWKLLYQNLDSLRLVFAQRDDSTPVQFINGVNKDIPVVGFKDFSTTDYPFEDAVSWMKQQVDIYMDIHKGNVCQLVLIKLGDSRNIIFARLHHIISDGYSSFKLMYTVIQVYKALAKGLSTNWLEHMPQYCQQALNMQGYLNSVNYQKDAYYWKSTLSDINPTRLQPKLSAGGGESCAINFPEYLCQSFRLFCQESQVSPLAVLSSVVGIYFSRILRQDTMLFGTAVLGRYDPESMQVFGMFVNVIPIKLQVSRGINFLDLVKRVRQNLRDSRPHRKFPTSHLARLLPNTINGISDIQVFYDGTNGQNYDGLDHLPIPVSLSGQPESQPLVVRLQDYQGYFGLKLRVDYSNRYFNEVEIQQLAERLLSLINQGIESSIQSISQFSILLEKEHQLLQKWNQTSFPYPQDRCIHELFEEQAEKNPEAVAVAYKERQLTYGELNQQANQLAYYLVEQGVKPNTFVGLCIERSLDMIVGVLGILKAGGAFVALDPTIPEQRLTSILIDCQPAVLLTQKRLVDTLDTYQGQLVCLDDKQTLFVSYPTSNLQTQLTSNNLAYVIYTSGSTGKPKGVLQRHDTIVNLVHQQPDENGLSLPLCTLQFMKLTFDVAIQEIATTWFTGGKLVLISESIRLDINSFQQRLKDERVERLFIVPSFFNLLAEYCNKNLLTLPDLKEVINVGEVLQLSHEMCNFLQRHANCHLWNHYGPSETHEVTTYYVSSIYPGYQPPIGKPLGNHQCYVLDTEKQLIAIGMVGELFVAGVGVATGYLNRPELTTEKFIENPFSDEANSRLYGTGDLVRWLPDGNLEYVGRTDYQVKVRGFRIELGEIEAILIAHPLILKAVVTAKENQLKDKLLVAYLVPATGFNQEEKQFISELRQFLKQQLPDYMIPTAFVVLDSLPLNSNGKVDRKGLPLPDGISSTPSFIAPLTPIEIKLAELWQATLNINEPISTQANFFESGGHSLLAIRLIAKINAKFSVELSVKALFNSPQLAELASLIKEAKHTDPSVPAVARRSQAQAELPLSYAQQRLWFIDQMERSSAHYNMPGVLLLEGQLDVNALNQALRTIIERHESLRTVFIAVNNQAQQQVKSLLPNWQVVVKDLRQLTGNALQQAVTEYKQAEASKPFDLGHDTLLRGMLLQTGDQQAMLLLTMHHIASDGWSIGVLINEFNTLYQAYHQGQPNPLLPLPIQYADYALWQRNWLQGEVLAKQVDYWRAQLQGVPGVHQLPLDKPRPSEQSFTGATFHCQLDKAASEEFLQYCVSQGATLFMGLHAAFSVLLSRYSGEMDIVIGTPVANREQLEIAPLIGFFVNTLVMRADLSTYPSFNDLLAQCKRTALDAYAHQQVPFEQLVEELQPARYLSHHPLFQVMLALQNNQMQSVNLPELTVTAQAPVLTIAKFDLTLNVVEATNGLQLEWEYNTDLFELATIKRLAGNFDQLIKSIITEPTQSVHQLQYLTPEETQQLLVSWNQTAAPYPQDRCIHELFEEQAEKNPEAVAVVFEEQQLTYSELNKSSNQLAHHLVKQGVKPDSLVGLCIERSVDMIVGLLGILKAGGAYVPLDPTMLAGRMKAILNDCQPCIVLSHHQTKKALNDYPGIVVCLDELDREWPEASTDNLNIDISANHLAYVIYTSGSTGVPKGVLQTHQTIVNLVYQQAKEGQLNSALNTLQLTTIAFDVALQEIATSWYTGSQLVLCHESTRTNMPALLLLLQASPIERLFIVPGLLSVLTEYLQQQAIMLPALKEIIMAGEALHITSSINWFMQQHTDCHLWNHYGPSETSPFKVMIQPKRARNNQSLLYISSD